MKHKYSAIIALAFATPTITAFSQGQAIEDHPAYLDIQSAIDISVTQPTVNVNLPKFLLNSALADLELPPMEPESGQHQRLGLITELKDLLSDVKLIRVLVFDRNSSHREVVEAAIPELKKQLNADWMPIVSVPEENVGIYAKGDASGEAMLGMAVVIDEGDTVIIANIVGDVSFGKIFKLIGEMRGAPGNPLEALLAPYFGPAPGSDAIHSYDLSHPEETKR